MSMARSSVASSVLTCLYVCTSIVIHYYALLNTLRLPRSSNFWPTLRWLNSCMRRLGVLWKGAV
jgi:hypothetical protein